MRPLRPLVAAAIAVALGPAPAAADILTLWAAAKADYVGGSSDVFTAFDAPFGGGVEGGIELIGIDVFGEALIMGTDQFLFTLNAGFDLSFGDDTRVMAGLFTGPIFFVFPEQEASTFNLAKLDPDVRTEIEAQLGAGAVDRLEADLNAYAEQEQDLNRLAFGWNLARLRLNVEHSLVPLIYLGVGAQAGYHLLISGEEVAAGAKNEAVDEAGRRYNLSREVRDAIREAVGADSVDQENLDGLNYQVGAYLKVEL